MNHQDLIRIAGDLPCFTVGFLAAGGNLAQIRLQLARWVNDGRVIKIHKGLYTLAELYRKINPEPFTIANALHTPSYVSLQSALSRHGMIPEFVPAVTSLTTNRPKINHTPLGTFQYRHILPELFHGFRQESLSDGQKAFIATPEKALLDLIYLTPGGDRLEFLTELRLQHLDRLNLEQLESHVRSLDRPKLTKAVSQITRLLHDNKEEPL